MSDPTATTQEPKLDIDQFYPRIYQRAQPLKSAVRGLNFSHLKDVPQQISKAVCAMVADMLYLNELDSPELTLAIQKTREAKDRFVTAIIWTQQDQIPTGLMKPMETPEPSFIERYPREGC